jgi:acetyl-CoA acetyltransferase family protein
VCDALLERAGVNGAAVEDVAWGCVTQSGAQAENAGRNVVLSSKRLPNSVPAFTLDRQCGSAQQALHLAAQAVMSGTQDCVIAGGVEMMSVVPMDSNVNSSWEGGPHTGEGIQNAYGERMKEEYAVFEADPVKFDQFVGAELVAKKYRITREDADAFAMRSHTLAQAASTAGRFAEIVPLPCRSHPGISKAEAPEEMHTVDEGIRPSTSIEALAKLKPILTNGVLTAAAASQICDGAAAMLVCNERGLQRLGLRPRARVVALGLAALDPVVMLEGPIPATQQVLAKAQLQIEDVDLVEVNEAFSSIPLAWAKAMTGGDLTKLNVNGGAIARGHPMGATGAMLMSNLVGELERRGGRYGLLTMCESGGTANATIVERVGHSGLVNTILAPSRLAPGPVSGGPAEPILEFARPSPQKGHAFMTMGRALTAIAAWKGQAPALTSAGPGTVAKQMNFTELDLKSNAMARAYIFFNVRRNDLVTIALPTGPEFVVVCFACWKLGATPNNVSYSLTFQERDEIIQLARPKIVAGVPNLRDPDMKLHCGYRCLREGFDPGPHLSVDPLPDAFANSWLVATSGGSTGRPKLIVLNEPSLVTMKDIGGGKSAMPDGFSITGGGKVNGIDLIPSPLSHNAPFHCAIQGILGASHQILLAPFDAQTWAHLIQEYRCTFSYLVPTTMKRIMDLPGDVRARYDVSSLEAIFHMAAPCPPWLKEAWCSYLGPEKIYECYGPTEATALTVIRGDEWLLRPKLRGLNLVGKPLYGELMILDPDTKEELPPGTMGEVWMRHNERRPTYYYIGADAQAHPGLGIHWESMGDMGMLDQDGYCHLGDRKKDMILVGGVNIYPAEIEAALEAHPAVRSAVVVGVQDDDLGNALHAVVYSGQDKITVEELTDFLKDGLARFKVPASFSFVDYHLRGEDGKCRRSEVAAMVNASLIGGSRIPSKTEQADKSQQALAAVPTRAVPSSVPVLGFAGRVAIVTGAGNGLGREYALLLAARGAKVVVNDLGSSLGGQGASSSLADSTVDCIRRAGGTAVANYDSVTEGESIVKTAIDSFGRVDIVVNNAGILRDVSFRKMKDEDWDLVYRVHLKGAFSVTKAAWRHMEENEYGRIVYVTSSTGLYGSFGQANYAAMKSAVLGLTYTLALEGKKRNIKVNAIAPLGASRMMETVRSKRELQALPLQSIAKFVAYLCHERCDSTGGVFELGGHWISRLGWRRSQGARFQAGFTLEDVAQRFEEISDFSQGTEYPADADSGEVHSMQAPLAKL